MTDEQDKNKIGAYVRKNGIQYLIAMGGANGYTTRGIPAAWLVSADGDVVWKGHPGNLTGAILDEHLKKARMIPPFDVPIGIKKVQKYVDAQQIGKAMTTLEKYIERPKDESLVRDAKKAVKRMKKYGDEQIKLARSYGKKGFYVDGMQILSRIRTAYKKTEVGDKAGDLLKAWKKDKKIKVEIEADKYLDKARKLSLGGEKDQATAIQIARAVATKKKFDGTKAQRRAKKLLKEWDA